MMQAIEHASGRRWTLYNGDAVEVLQGIPDSTIGYSVFSPPFANLYTYSNSDRDLGNCRTQKEFIEHFAFVLSELSRVLMPGRSVSMHCMDLPTVKVRDGYIGLRDFPGELIRAGERAGLIYHSSVVIWKDPVTAMQRTKALGLLHKTIRNDSSMARMGIPDRVVTLRKPGENPKAIPHSPDSYPVSKWQAAASPVWMDIDPSDTLQYRAARDEADERHIAPLQLGVIRRCVELWSAPDDIVLTPFAGIGSELFVAVEMGRKAVGVELKQSYFQQAVRNLREAEETVGADLFAAGLSDVEHPGDVGGDIGSANGAGASESGNGSHAGSGHAPEALGMGQGAEEEAGAAVDPLAGLTINRFTGLPEILFPEGLRRTA